jgi:inosine-uridine nucleoside N-ribohydrolase
LKAPAAIALALLAAACVADGGSEARRSPSTVASNADVRHVVVDTDLAFDDIMALLYLLQRDDVAIDAVTITGTGEAHCAPGVRNALALLALGGELDTPVACGRETPLLGTNAFPDEWRAAVDDLSMVDLPAVDRGGDPRGAVQLLLDTLDGDTALITLGPLTNVAEALRDDPELGSRVSEFVAMAGAIDVAGNSPNGVAEFNVWVDPLAAKEVIEGMSMTLVPLDATDDVPFTSFFADTLAAHRSSPEAEAAAAIIAANQEIFLQDGYSFWDTLATALVFRPELATWDATPVVVTASQDAGAGWIDRWDEGAPVRFATAVPDPLAFEREYLSVLTGETITQVRPDPTITISFDGDRCTMRPRRLSPGDEVVAYVDEPGSGVGSGCCSS